jgi:uncharacterized protein
MHEASGSVVSYARLHPLPPGSIRPAGWLRQYAEMNANAWLLRYARARDPEVYGKFWHRNPSAKVTFDENNVTQVLCDYTAYFADGLLHYAALLPDSPLAAEAEPWMDQLLASQDADGYLGAFQPQARWQHWLEIFSQALTLEALLHRYELTGERRLLDACERAAQLQLAAWFRPGPQANPGIFSGHGSIVVRALAKLYALTGQRAYLATAAEILAKYGRMNEFLHTADGLRFQHNSVGSEHAGLPAVLYEYSGDPMLLEASRAAWEQMAQYHLAVDGSPHGNEDMQFRGPLHNCEHCGCVDWTYSTNALARMTGEVKYADAAERAMYNAYPAAKSVDGMTVAYMHTPNQLVASEWSQPHGWTSPDWCASRQHYHSAHEPLCCNVNGPRGLPYFAEWLVMRSGSGLAFVYYAPCQVEADLAQAGRVTLLVDTDYPFEDEVRIELRLEHPAAFPLRLRIPGWCSGAEVSVGGGASGESARPGTYAMLERTWHDGDRVTLHFDCPIRLEKWERSEFGVRAGGVAVMRGPLTFALPVAEDWQPFTAPAHGPGQQLESYRVLPAENAAWNYALLLDQEHPEESLELARLPRPAGSRAWENAPFGLRARAHRVLNWRLQGEADHIMTPLMPFNPLQLADEVEEVTLVPFGFTHLRMTYLPTV